MRDNQDILTFPSKIPELRESKVFGIALESGGYVEEGRLHELQLNQGRRIYILLAKPDELDASSLVQNVNLNGIRVEEKAFRVDSEPHLYASIGRKCGWMPFMRVSGRMVIDDILPLPWIEIFEDERLPAKATVAVGELGRNSRLLLPSQIQDQEVGRQYYIFGQDIRTVDTFPNTPGGGTRIVA